MAKVLCCNVYQHAKVFKVVPTKDKIEHEFVLYLESCFKCGSQSLMILRVDIQGNKLEPVRLKTKNIRSFLNSIEVIRLPQERFKIPNGYYSWVLEYNEWGNVRKCASNLHSVKLGMIETDPIKDLEGYLSYQKSSELRLLR